MSVGVKVPSYDSITIDISLYVHEDLLYIVRYSYVTCINVYKGYILFLDYSLNHYVLSFFVSLYIAFALKFISSDINFATPAFFLFPFA